jgi:hypothetical protein
LEGSWKMDIVDEAAVGNHFRERMKYSEILD